MFADTKIINWQFPESIDVYPIADVHLGALEHAEKEWDAFVKRVTADPKAYLILAGDLLNNNVRGTRFANPFDEVIRPREQKQKMVEYLFPLRDKILCIVPGNHENRTGIEVDQDPVYDICCKLDVEDYYRQNIAFMRISCGIRNFTNKKPTPECTYNFVVAHGTGSGRTGATVNRDEAFAGTVDGLDCLITGHVHKGFITRPSKFSFSQYGADISKYSYLITGAVSWLNYGGYAARAMLAPAEVANPQILRLSEKHNDKRITTVW